MQVAISPIGPRLRRQSRSLTAPARTRRIELRALEVFITVADTGSMTLAARKLCMTQPAVSQVVRALERNVGSPVLDRDLRPLRLTPTGVFVLARARQLLADADRLCTDVRLSESSVLPRFRIGFVDSFASTIGPVIATSMKNEVEQLLVSSGVAQELRNGLINRELDMIVSSDALEDVPGTEQRRLLRESFVIITPIALQRRAGEFPLGELVATLPLIRFSKRTQIGVQIDNHLGWLRIDTSKRTEFDSADAVIAVVAEGGGWAMVPPLALVRASPWLSKIAIMPFPGPVLTRSIYLVSRARELSGISERIAARCLPRLQLDITPKLRSLAPWLTDHVVLS